MDRPTIMKSKDINNGSTKEGGGVTLTGGKNKTQLMKAMSAKQKDRCASLLHFWRHQDVFGEKVEFTYKGKRSYQTMIGATMSVIIKAVLCLFIGYEFYVIFSRKHPMVAAKYQINSFVDNPMEKGHGYNPFEDGFDISFGFLT